MFVSLVSYLLYREYKHIIIDILFCWLSVNHQCSLALDLPFVRNSFNRRGGKWKTESKILDETFNIRKQILASDVNVKVERGSV